MFSPLQKFCSAENAFFFRFFLKLAYFCQTFTLVKDYPRMIGNFSNSSRSYVTVYYKAFCEIYMYTRTIRLSRKKRRKEPISQHFITFAGLHTWKLEENASPLTRFLHLPCTFFAFLNPLFLLFSFLFSSLTSFLIDMRCVIRCNYVDKNKGWFRCQCFLVYVWKLFIHPYTALEAAFEFARVLSKAVTWKKLDEETKNEIQRFRFHTLEVGWVEGSSI